MTVRIGDCCCCTDEPAITKNITHRDLTTGDPHSEFENLDARELLWGTEAGDVAGLTQETITQNCTATGSAITKAGNGADDTDGLLRMAIEVTPTQRNFAALQVVWTGQTFDAFAHVSHIAAGSVAAYAAASRRLDTTFSPENMRSNLVGGTIEPTPVWGVVIRSGSTILVKLTPNPGATGLDSDPTGHTCWRPTDAASNSPWRILADGKLSSAALSATEARAHGLTVDAIATQVTHTEVGLCFGIITGQTWDGDLDATYKSTYDFDTLNIYREYFIACPAAFTNLTTLYASMPAHSVTSNVEPVEMRGLSTALTLTSLSAWNSATDSNAVKSHHDNGYAYIGSRVVALPLGDVTVKYWYTPCVRLTMSFDQSSVFNCPVWVHINHSDEYTDDDCDGYGDYSNGLVTAPTIVGYARRDFYWRCYNGSGTQHILDVKWYGVDCVDHPHQTSPTQVHGIVGECHGTDMGQTLPVCLEGNSPNQLTWATDCWSLDPIAIGYRRRVNNVSARYGGWSPSCGAGADPCDFAPDGQYRFQRDCVLSFLEQMGFSFALEYIHPVAEAGHFYVDITE